jgi:GWxTD domain-containing protein
MKKIIYTLFLCIALIMSLMSDGFCKVSATIEYACFPSQVGAGRLFLVIGIDGRSLTIQKLANKKYQSTATFAIVVNDSTKNYFAEKIDFQSPEFSDTNQLKQYFTSTKTIPLAEGKYNLELLAFDVASKDTSREKAVIQIVMPGFKENTSTTTQKLSSKMSDILLLNESGFSVQKSIFDQNAEVFRLSNFYSERDTVLSFYCENVGLDKIYPDGLGLISRLRLIEVSEKRSLDEFGRIKKIKSKAQIASRFDINIKNLPTGKYFILWDLIDSSNKVVARTQKEIVKSNPSIKTDYVHEASVANGSLEEQIANLSMKEARLFVASLQPISLASDQTSIDYLRKKGTEPEVRNFLQTFWSKKSKENPLAGFTRYKELIAEAEKKYATKTMPAYQTDRGRVFLQYGKPNMVENEYSDRFRQAMKNLNTVPYEIWYYYTMETPVKQNDIIFVFIQENRGNDNYRLFHSTGLGEVRNREWRKSVETNATYNFDRMDPNDRYDANDSKKFR